MFISRHTLKWTKTCRSSGDFPHAHTAHFRLNRHRCAGCSPAPMTPSASHSPKRLPSSCPHGRSQIDVRNGMRPLRDPRPQAARRQAPRSTRNRLAAHGLAARGPGHVAAARPRTRPEPPGPARFALAGREPRVASDLPADRGRMPSRHHGHAAHARPVAPPNPDDLPSLFRQVRIHLAQGATPLRLAIRTISNLTGAALSIRQRASHHAVIMLL